MANVGTVELVASINTANYKRGAREIDQANNSIEKSSGKASQVASKAWDIASKAIIASTAVAAAGVSALVVGAVKSTANLEQSLGGSEVVFAEYSKEIQELARNSAKVMGTSQNQYLETANKMGSLFQGAGFDIRKSMELTTSAMQRATDVATAMGIDTSMALESIAGAAKGNFTMMDNLGVAMNDTTLEAYRLEKGIDKAVTKMTNAEKVGLAMELFMERTAKYAGNYAKENDTLAGSFQTLRGAWGNFLSGVEGSDKVLVDAGRNMTRVLGREIPVIMNALADGVMGIYKELKDTSPEFRRYAEMVERTFRTVITVVNTAVNLFRTFAPVIAGVTSAFIAYKAVIIAANAVTAIQSALIYAAGTRMLIYNGAVIGVSRAVTAATIAQAAWNTVLSLNPIGLVIGAIAGLVGILAVVLNSTDRNKTATDRLNEARRIQEDRAIKAKEAEDKLRGSQLGVESATLGVERATRNYNDAVDTYGRESLEAREAALHLKRANGELESATETLNKDIAEQSTNLNHVNDALNNLNGKSVSYSVVGKVHAWEQDGQQFWTEGFSSGGFTGRGRKNEPAGIVHKGEYVLPQSMVDQTTGEPKIGSQVEYNIGTITISSEVDGERWLRRLTNNQEIVSSGLVPQQGYM